MNFIPINNQNIFSVFIDFINKLCYTSLKEQRRQESYEKNIL